MRYGSIFQRALYLVAILCLSATAFAETAPGTVQGEGTHFAITDSQYLNVTLDSSEPVSLLMESVPETISMQVESASAATQTQITVSGLMPSTDYYQYDDTSETPVVITANANGQHSFLLDISAMRVIMLKSDPDAPEIAPVQGTETGTHFEVTGSEYLDVTVDSSETIELNITSVPQVITMNIEGTTGAASSSLDICGLLPASTYYKYEDDFHNLEEFTSDALGCYSYEQDLTTGHLVFIQTNRSTKFLRDDATGGDCTLIGTWDSATKTCTLTTDVHETIQLDSDNITLDGNGHSLIGPGSTGVYGYRRNGVTVKNLTITDFTYGINISTVICTHWYCQSSLTPLHSNTIINNNISNGYLGISIDSRWRYGYNNVISDNTVTNTNGGIALLFCAMTIVENNTLQGKGKSLSPIWQYSGISLERGGGRAAYNTVSGFGRGISVYYPNWSYGFNHNAFNIHMNLVDGNNYGLYTQSNWGSSSAEYNTISNNTVGYVIDDYASYTYRWNNFMNNTTQFLDWVNDWSGVSFYKNWYSHYDTPEEGCYDNDVNGYCDDPLFIYYEPRYGGSNDYEYKARTSMVPGTPLPPSYNQLPVADAGPDQTIECAGPSGTSVTLNGGGSSDPDGDALTYSWSGPFDTASGVSPAVTLPLGVHAITLTVDDGVSGTSSDTVIVTVRDTTPPSTSAVIEGVLGENGWYVSDVTVTLISTDSCSGVKEVHYTVNGEGTEVPGDTATFTLTEDGIHTVRYWAVDNADNTETENSTPVQRETAPPVTTPTVPPPPPGTGGYYTGCVNVQLDTASGSSGTKFTKYSYDGTDWADYTGQVTVCNDGSTDVYYKAKSNAGNEETPKTITIKIDTTPPVTTYALSGTMGSDGWYVSDVTVTLTATDANSGVAEIHYVLDGVETVVSDDTASFVVSADGPHTVMYWARDVASNTEAEQGPVGFKIDQTPPVITITGVTEGTKYPLCSPPSPDYTVTDTTSGMPEGGSSATTDGGNANGVGTFTYSVTATDNAGNAVTEAVTYKVVYSFDGFQTPVTLDKPFKSGSTIPVKFVLTEGCGVFVPNATATLSLLQLTGTEPLGQPIDGSTNVPDSGNVFRYDLTDNHYIYNLSTDGLLIGTWRATVTLDDGETYSIDIGLK